MRMDERRRREKELSMKRGNLWLAMAVLIVSVAGPVLASGGSSTSATVTPALTPQQLAIEDFNRGLRYRDKAWELEKKAEDSAKADKLLVKAEKSWGRAVSAFQESIANEPTMYQSHGSLGYSYRKLGRFEEALQAYDRALELRPTYVEAIEYRAEAYLGLDRIDDAKEAYMQLFRLDRAEAETLMGAMETWLETERQQQSSQAGERLDDFGIWLQERSEIASQTAMLTTGQGRSW